RLLSAGNILALSQGCPEPEIARLHAGAREHEIAQARKAGQRLAARAQRGTEPAQLRKGPRDEGSACTFSQAATANDPTGDGQDVLYRAADLHPHEIIGDVRPKGR